VDPKMPAPARTSRPRWLGLPRRLALGFGAALVSLVAAALASHAALDALASASRLVRHTAEARHALEEVESALLVSHTALEAFLAGREARHAERFLVASTKVRPALEALELVAEQHPEEKARIAELVADVRLVDAEQHEVLDLVEAGDVTAARALDARGAGHAASERAALLLAEIEADETRLHEGREAAWRRSVTVSNFVFLTALLVLFVLTLVAARLVGDEIRRREAETAAREQALLVQQRIMAVVSHDLRNPLTGILAAGWALGKEPLGPKGEALVRRVVGAGSRMEHLIRDLLDWSRVQGGAAIPVHPAEADLADVCRRMADELRDREGARIEVDQEGDTSALFDPARVEQVVSNLVSNALRHGAPGGAVRVRAVGTPDEVRVEVENEGPEIPPAARATIFEPFRQGPDGKVGGVGLGLFIVRALTEAHGGTVALDSAHGRTTFVVRLPRGAPDARARGAAPRALAGAAPSAQAGAPTTPAGPASGPS
jgi:signal transduction histidine kinase